MSVIPGGSLTTIFEFFEQGSDGKKSAEATIDILDLLGPEEKLSPVVSAAESFTGYFRIIGAQLYFETQGGGRFIVHIDEALLGDYVNQLVSITGKQVGDTIGNVRINLRRPATAVKSKGRLSPQTVEIAVAAQLFLERYKGKIPGLLYARPGYKYVDGKITNLRAITAIVEKKKTGAVVPANQTLPETFEGIDVEVVTASPKDLLRFKLLQTTEERAVLNELAPPTLLDLPSVQEAAVLEAGGLPANNYIPPANVQLEEITAPMTLICHVSPEEGWKNLSTFLDDTNEHLQIAIYDFSAPAVFETLKTVARRGTSIKMVYDGNPAAGVGEGTKEDDVKEQTIINSLKRISGGNFEFVKAWKGKQGICANSYHIKVVVKDQKSVWLSSGNMQSSNQPAIDFRDDIPALANYNREWNMVVSNTKLATIFHKFIDWDFERSNEKPEAELLETLPLPELFVMEAGVLERGERFMYFPSRKFVFTRNNPLKVQPVLSPDNYMEHAKKVIKSATSKLYFQNQYINVAAEITDEYDELLRLLAAKTNDVNIDCRIILRKPFSTADKMEMFNNLKEYGFNMSKIKLMKNTHTKGIIADGKRIMIGSHNWSNSGVEFNRDASLVIYNEDVAGYYEDIFVHDWERRTIKESNDEDETVELDGSTEAALLENNMKPIDWQSYFE